MSPQATQRTVDDSRVQMTEIVLPEDSNAKGSVFGGLDGEELLPALGNLQGNPWPP